MQFYKEGYFNPILWLINEYQSLNISLEEFLFMQCYFYKHTYKDVLKVSEIIKLTKFNLEKIETIISDLNKDNYIKIQLLEDSYQIDFSNLFEFKFNRDNKLKKINLSSTQKIEKILGRTLNSNECFKILELEKENDADLFNLAIQKLLVSNLKHKSVATLEYYINNLKLHESES